MEFEDRIKKIKEIITLLNSPEITLKDGMKLYKEGISHITQAQKMLEEAQNTYNEIKLDEKEQ